MFPFEELEVYQVAFAVNQEVYQILKDNKSIPIYLKNQLGRSSLAILRNIAEGSALYRTSAKARFYAMGRCAAFDCASLLGFLSASAEIDSELETRLCASYESVSKMLFMMIHNIEAGKKRGRSRWGEGRYRQSLDD